VLLKRSAVNCVHPAHSPSVTTRLGHGAGFCKSSIIDPHNVAERAMTCQSTER
jgi:hypothetical protein